jgi:hypothetical protein
VLKKAGIVVAVATAGLLAVSPLAFAGDKGDPHFHGHDGKHDGKKVQVEDVNHFDDSNKALINVADNNVAVNACNNGDIELISIIDDVAGALTLLGGEAKADASDVRVCEQDAGAGDSVVQKIAD